MLIRLYKAGNAGFSVVVKHDRNHKLGTAMRFCKDKAAVVVFMEQEVGRHAEARALHDAVLGPGVLL